MERIAILTSGGDAPGMNACIRAVTRFALNKGLKVFGVERGYQGLIDNDVHEMHARSVSDIIQRGGTVLKTARCAEFVSIEGQQKAMDSLKKHKIDALVVIGGNGSFMGVKDLKKNFGFNAVGIPGTIDNDLQYTDFTLGFDTAVNTCLSAINNIRDTMTSHDRISIVEVMGRKCGDIALYTALCGGAETVLIPEMPYNIIDISRKLIDNAAKGKSSDIIILSEGVCSAQDLKIMLKGINPQLSFRPTTLGHIQRGGSPSMADRTLASSFGVRAVELLMEGKSGRVVGIKDNAIIDMDIDEALSCKGEFNKALYERINILSI